MRSLKPPLGQPSVDRVIDLAAMPIEPEHLLDHDLGDALGVKVHDVVFKLGLKLGFDDMLLDAPKVLDSCLSLDRIHPFIAPLRARLLQWPVSLATLDVPEA